MSNKHRGNMKKTELKKVLKPLIKDCIKEILFEEGILSNIVSEVVRGVQPMQVAHVATQTNVIDEQSKALDLERRNLLEQRAEAERQRKISILNATGFSDVFKDVKPISEQGVPGASKAQGALAGVDPSDAGVDISGIFALGGKKWKQLAG